MKTTDMPIRYPAANDAARDRAVGSHDFGGEDGRCFRCDMRAGSISSSWPCGTTPPRTKIGWVEVEVRDVLTAVHATSIAAAVLQADWPENDLEQAHIEPTEIGWLIRYRTDVIQPWVPDRIVADDLGRVLEWTGGAR
jgi:hypothetical protein